MNLPECVRCGYCCKEAPCVHGSGSPCLYLVQQGAIYSCSLVLTAAEEEKEYYEIDLDIGGGCVRAYNEDRKEMISASSRAGRPTEDI